MRHVFRVRWTRHKRLREGLPMTYDYECKKCEYRFEAEQRITEPPLKRCVRENCGGEVKRLISAPGFVLKGNGWYKDGYGNSK